MTTRVGVLFVHGIGEQGRFEHLEAQVRNLVTAWEEAGATVRVEVNSAESGAFGAQQETWQADTQPPISVHIDQQNQTTQVDFREVWWADLDEPTTPLSQFRFWFWGLSLWNTRRYVHSTKSAFDEWMRPPDHWCDNKPGITAATRVKFFALGMILLMTFFTLSLVNFLVELIFRRRPIASDILVNYLGDVKLYQQQWRSGKGPLGSISQPPRVALRQRMVRQMLRMANGDYDRWYILAHSQGTVLAMNALMEPAERLPHYLNRKEWEEYRAKLASPQGLTNEAWEAKLRELLAELQPPRPSWLAAGDRIDRQRLFARLRGLLTYGSPIETFASLWPAIVPLNQDEAVFRDDFEWINIIDPTDPVATRIHNFDPVSGPHPRPRNLSYKAGGWYLLSHIRYLTFQKNAPERLVHKVGAWLQTGTAFPQPPVGAPHWPTPRRSRLLLRAQTATSLGVALVLAVVLGQVTNFVLCQIAQWMPSGSGGATAQLCETLTGLSTRLLPTGPTWLVHGAIALLVCGGFVLIAGVIARTPICRYGRL